MRHVLLRYMRLAALACPAFPGCASRTYTHYLLDEAIETNDAFKEGGTPLRPYAYGATSVMKVRWNDGGVFTEVDVPLFGSGQRVVVQHGKAEGGGASKAPAKLVPPPPSGADGSLSEAYRERGLKENTQAPDVSISRSKVQLQDALRTGNYAVALETCETVLARYPSHPDFLRAKGSVLLLMGEREKAIETYEKAEEVESDAAVKRKLEELRKK